MFVPPVALEAFGGGCSSSGASVQDNGLNPTCSTSRLTERAWHNDPKGLGFAPISKQVFFPLDS